MNTHTVEELYRLAQQGNTEALTRLGICYKNGTGTAVDHSAAAQCFYSAANASVLSLEMKEKVYQDL